jgi:hypothetical protein
MNNYEDWANLVAKNLAHEADFIAAIDKDELDDKAASEAFIRAVLEPFLPENYGIGAGRVIDAFGNCSEYLDIIVYNRDFPRIGMRGTHNAYLYESVLAAFAIRAKFIRKTFFDSLNTCASLSHLQTKVDQAVMVKLAKKNGLKPGPNRTFVHDDPLRTGRFELIGRPPAFVFGFSGIKYSYRQLQENIELWISNRQNAGIKTPMKALPAVIATQGCFAWRNAAPLALSNRQMLGIGNDDAPVRLIALQLLYLLNRRLNVTSDGYGLKPSLNAYLSHFEAPKFELGVGDVNDEVNAIAAADDDTSPGTRAARDTARFEPARDRATIEQAAAKAMVETAAASKPKPAPAAASPAPAPAAAEKAPETPAEPAVFDKPSPFASAPIPPADKPVKTDPPAEAAVFDKPSPFASAPTLSAEEPTPPEPARSPAPVAPLGSAPIPGTQDSTATMPVPEIPAPAAPLGSAPIPPSEPPKPAASAPAAAKVIPPKPPVDIDLGFGDASTEDKPESEDDDFSRNSTDAFIARVKEQLSTSEPPAGNEKDFTSTIPQ